jgi:hypothetical protein
MMLATRLILTFLGGVLIGASLQHDLLAHVLGGVGIFIAIIAQEIRD